MESIAKTLGTGSGIDIASLVDGLVQASFANKNAALTARDDKLTAQISKASELKSGISDFATALSQLAAGGTLATQPTSANTGIVKATRLAGAGLAALNASVEVRQIAQGQVASTPAFAGGATTTIGTGTLTLSFGTATVTGGTMTDFVPGAAAPVTITISPSDNTLQGVANAINAATAGVTASVITDSNGARLMVKSATGASQAFELTGSAGLESLNIGRGASGSTINAAAQNALVALDGVEVSYPVNSISNLIPGVRLDLVAALPGTKVAIGATRPGEAIGQAVTNFVDTYNQVYKLVKDAVDPATGPLRGDPAAKDLLRQLKGMTLAGLIPATSDETPTTLADVGVATQRDGTLRVDSTRLAKVLTTWPDQIEAMFASGAGLAAALSKVAESAVGKTSAKGIGEATGLTASLLNYGKAQGKVEEDQENALAAAEKLRTRMTQQFAAMDSKVAAYKSTQSFLTQQIAAWNADR
ncbi:flagellar filament capping protein FliD [Sphingomonas psychrotolerans]|uniref:Flagellar hook-associated protein 2 n=1 Tax=Sphingomonas psychrotolerans TaxID=1327635 RepID=A0ABU3NB80_9SPHN|nr:flagellar filament capping protein FliD [Sphingomonas psychrotolerans]MDT8760670.1 flagellar filament capping protein FliD [Sphingomonas psychrotolerans]